MAPDDFPAGGYTSDYLAFWAIWVAIVAGTWIYFRRTRGRTGRARLVAGNLLVFATLLWTAVVAGETYLRYVYDATDQWALTLTNFSWFRRHYRANSLGFRDREFTGAKPPGTVRVGCVGDSFTMGWGVRDANDTYPQRLGTALEAKAPGGFQVLNLGVNGTDTAAHADFVARIAPKGGLDRVILGYCLNDTDDLFPDDRRFLANSMPRVPWISPTCSFVADFLWFRLRLRSEPRVKGYFDWELEAYQDPKIWNAQCERFRRIAETCSKSGIRLDVVVFPFFADWGENYRFGICHDRVAQAWKKLGVDAIDLRDAYRGIPGSDLAVNRFDAHPNERAHAMAAQTLLDRLF